MGIATLDERIVTISPHEAATRLGVKRSTLNNWRWRGVGPSFVKIGNRVRYRTCDLATYLDAQTRQSTSDRGSRA